MSKGKSKDGRVTSGITVDTISSGTIGLGDSGLLASTSSGAVSAVGTRIGTVGSTIDGIDMDKLKRVLESPSVTTTITTTDLGLGTTTTPYYYPSNDMHLPPPVGFAELPIYAEYFLPHLVRAKEEGTRRGIEMDTVVIDRGVAVSQGVDHADMILGLRVKYAKGGSLPMDSAFVLTKKKEGKKESEPKEKEDTLVTVKSRGKKFLVYTENPGDPLSAPKMLNTDYIIAANECYTSDGKWEALEIIFSKFSKGVGTESSRIVDKAEAERVIRELAAI